MERHLVAVKIMSFLRLLPVTLSMLLLSAHFLRAQNPLLAFTLLALPFLLLIKREWVARLIQVVLALGALGWLRTLISLALLRNAMGEDWGRMALILGSVALFTAASVLVFSYNEGIKDLYGLTKDAKDATN